MKYFISLILFYLIPAGLYSQDTIRNFQIEDKNIIWLKIIDTDMLFNDILENITESGIISIENINEDKITGHFKSLNPDFKSIGYTTMNVPMIISRNTLEGFLILEYKPGKYRITIKRIYFNKKYDDGLSKQDEKTSLETISLTRNNTFNNVFQKSISDVLNHTFLTTFQFEKKKVDEW